MTLLLALLLMAAPEPALPGWLGMGYVWSSSGKAKVLVVQRVAPGGPAERAGIRPGDVVTTMNGRAVGFGDELDFLLFLADRKPGERVRLAAIREGKQLKIEVKLGTMPETSRATWNRNLDVAKRKRLAASRTSTNE